MSNTWTAIPSRNNALPSAQDFLRDDRAASRYVQVRHRDFAALSADFRFGAAKQTETGIETDLGYVTVIQTDRGYTISHKTASGYITAHADTRLQVQAYILAKFW